LVHFDAEIWALETYLGGWPEANRFVKELLGRGTLCACFYG
jgi:hypothetical protein